MSQRAITVVVAHGQDLIRGGLRMILGNDPGLLVVGEAGTLKQVEQAVVAEQPRVLVVGGHLPGATTRQVVARVHEIDPSVRLLALADLTDDDSLLGSLVHGAAICLLEEMSATDLNLAVKRVASGQIFLDPKVTHRLLDLLIESPASPRRAEAALSPREREVLRGLADGLTNRQIGGRLGLSEKTVKNYVTVVFSKLGMERRSQAAAFAPAFLSHG